MSGFAHYGSRPAAAAACVLLCLGTTAPARGATLSANTSNDALSGNEFRDDLYTAAVGLSLKLPGHRLSLEERMFTDRTSGTRFDETRFGWDVEIREIRRWQPSVQVGAVRVGRGILGQPFQNAAHRLVDSDPVDLEYPDEDRLFPSLDLAIRRDLAMTQTLRLTPLVEASGAAGFRYHVGAAVRATYRPLWAIELHGELGARLDRVDYTALQPWIPGAGMTWQAGVLLFDHVRFHWSYNEYGTGAHHLHFGFRIPLGADRRRNQGASSSTVAPTESRTSTQAGSSSM